ncbi:sugar ABC transporter ATP-binding protein [Bacillus sp. J14TS2]|uniref:carbohydrate ABC transporter permease n=1 Tax=Bacillus sp. J14TS2 TaxID=2807188 RepID=UPI001B0457EF|nr:carbohydrate ABC transporter permease [Bacillus sp. J14TS2]GIN71450.1 sugar ABC transporter ATP-binding protein [Bacillus sp. J14TS2]
MESAKMNLQPSTVLGLRNKKKIDMVKIFMTMVMFILAILMIAPFLWMLSTSFKGPAEVFRFPIQWIPSEPKLEHHLKVWGGENSFITYYLNSLKVAVIGTTGAIIIGSMAAYGFAQIAFKGRELIFIFYLSMMMVPPQVLFVPKFIMFDWAGIFNTHWSLILPSFVTIFGVFFLRQFFMSIPKEIAESAFIDGAGHFRIFFRIFMPLAKPAIATFAIIDFSWNWNNYEDALVFLLDEKLYTVPLGLQNFVHEFSIDYNGMMAAAAAAIVPMLIIFFIGQKYIIEGVASSAVKG